MMRLRDVDDAFFSEQFLELRPLLRAPRHATGAVLLIDEIDKADQEFEAFLLEVLSDYAVTIPEIGTVSAIVPPLMVLTSNNARSLGDALKHRCLHLRIGYPDRDLETRIVDARVPNVEPTLRAALIGFVQRLRFVELKKLRRSAKRSTGLVRSCSWAQRSSMPTSCARRSGSCSSTNPISR